jgi:hypothetical protein
VVTQVAKQYREQIAVALLAVAVIYLGCGLGLLFKSYDNSSIDFAVKSALDGYVFSHPVLVACIALAVLLVAVWGEPSLHARTLVLAAVGIGAVALVFAVITWIAGFSSENIRSFVGVDGAGKVIGAFLGLAQIALLVLVLFFAGIALQALPRPVQAGAHWGSPYQPGWGPGPDWQQQSEWVGTTHPGGPQYPGQPPPWASPPQGQWGGGQAPGWQQPQQPAGWGQQGPPDQGWQPGPPTQAYDQRAGAEAPPATPASNAERYWRSAPAQSASQAETPEPSHLAPEAAESSEPASGDPFAEPGEHRDPGTASVSTDDAPTVGSWSSDAGARASELAADSAEPADADSDADSDAGDDAEDDDGVDEPRAQRVEERDDDSGWWRPSSST